MYFIKEKEKMKLKSVTKENKKLGEQLATSVFEEMVESAKINKDLEVALTSYIEALGTEESRKYKNGTFEECLEMVNLSESLVEYIRLWDADLVALIREYQNKYSSNLVQYKEKVYYSFLPFILVTLDKERNLINNTQKFYELHKDELEKHLIKLIKFRLKDKSESKKSKTPTFSEFCDRRLWSNTPKKLAMIQYKEYLNTGSYNAVENKQKYSESIAKKFKKQILSINNNLIQLSYKSMVKDYFGLDLLEGKNTPKLARQLKKSGIDYTDEEIRHFGEVEKWWNNWLSKENYTIDGDYFRVADLWVDTKDFEIPYIVDNWAFNGSCNISTSSAGSDTHLVLKHFGFEYLKGYSTVYKKGKLELVPSMRTYFLRDGDDIAHAGTYADFDGTRAKACYEFTTVLLCILFNKKIGDFHKIRGMNIYCDHYHSDLGGSVNFWANQADNDYAKWGTASIFERFNREDIEEYCNTYPSLKYTLENASKREMIIIKENHMLVKGELIKDYRKNKTEQNNDLLNNILNSIK